MVRLLLVGTVALAIATAVSYGKAEDDDDGSQKIAPENAGEEEPGKPGKEKDKERDDKRVKEEVEEKGTNTQVKDEAVVEEKNEKVSEEEGEAAVQVDEDEGDDIPEKKKKKKVGSKRDYTNIPQSEKEMFGSKSLRCLVCRALVEEFNYAVTSVDPKKKVETGGYRLNARGEREVKVVRNHHHVHMHLFLFAQIFLCPRSLTPAPRVTSTTFLTACASSLRSTPRQRRRRTGSRPSLGRVAPKRPYELLYYNLVIFI